MQGTFPPQQLQFTQPTTYRLGKTELALRRVLVSPLNRPNELGRTLGCRTDCLCEFFVIPGRFKPLVSLLGRTHALISHADIDYK